MPSTDTGSLMLNKTWKKLVGKGLLYSDKKSMKFKQCNKMKANNNNNYVRLII